MTINLIEQKVSNVLDNTLLGVYRDFVAAEQSYLNEFGVEPSLSYSLRVDLLINQERLKFLAALGITTLTCGLLNQFKGSTEVSDDYISS